MKSPIIPETSPGYHRPGQVDQGGQSALMFRALRLLGFLRKFWWIPACTLTIAIGIEAAYVHWKEPVFVCRSSMWETLKLRLPEGSLFSEDSQSFLGTQTELLQSGTLRNQALELMRADSNSAAAIPLGNNGQPLPPPVGIHVIGSGKSSVFTIEATSSNPLFTQVYLDALMQAYLNYKKTIRKVVSGDTLASVAEQMQKWERDLKLEQDTLSIFEKTNNFTILQQESMVSASYLTKLKTQLSDLQLEARIIEAAEKMTNAAGKIQMNGQAPGVFATKTNEPVHSPAGSLDQQPNSKDVELLQMQETRLATYLKPKHPKMIKLREEIERALKVQEITNRENRDQLAAARKSNRLRMENVMLSIKEWENKVVEENNLLGEAEHLKLNVQRIQSVYDRLAMLVQNLGISRNIDQESLAILEPASSVQRSYAKEKSSLNLSIMGGLGAGVGLIFLISLHDDRVTSVIEINSALGDAVVGVLPAELPSSGGEPPLLEFNDSRHVYAESYRSLRSALLFFATESQRPKVLLVTSALPNEGKSTVAANLARTLAFSGARVLLVDADLRRGHLHQSLHLQSSPGLAELLGHKCNPETVVQTNSLTNLFFIARGSRARNPGDLFLASNLDQILDGWRREFDYVVIDSSPVFAADDASCLAPKVDGTLFVVRSHHSSARAVREALETLAQRQAKVIGVVFNGINASARSYPYYKYADYSNSDSVPAVDAAG